MPYSEDPPFIFVHIPKTAGTSIEKALKVYNKRHCLHGPTQKQGYMQHWTSKQLFEKLGKIFYCNTFSFTVVRNPFDRIVSEFCYLKGLKDPWVEGKSFTDFVNTIPEEKGDVPWHIWQHLRPQADYVWLKILDKKVIGVSMVVDFDNLNDEWPTICEKIGVDYKPLPNTKKSKRRDYRDGYYTKETASIVSRIYSKDIQLMGYEF